MEEVKRNTTEKAEKNLDDEYIGIIIGALAALILLLFAVIIVIIMRHRRNKYNNNHRTMKPMEPRNVTLDLSDIRLAATNGKLLNGQMYNCVATSEEGELMENNPGFVSKQDLSELYGESTGIQARKLPSLPRRTPESSGRARAKSVPACFCSSLPLISRTVCLQFCSFYLCL